MTVLDPVKLILDNYPEGQTEELPAIINPEDPESEKRMVPFSRELYIEREDFMENPPKKYFRLTPGAEVRLKYAYIIRCDNVVKDEDGNVMEIHCTYFPETRSGNETTRKVKGTLHWVEIATSVKAEVRLYDRLFTVAEPEDVQEGQDFKDFINPDSLKVVTGYCEPFAGTAVAGQGFQFERLGYFCADKDCTPDKLIFNRTVTLRDSWTKAEQKS
jgi:glutaminyl-tRNA synthetase